MEGKPVESLIDDGAQISVIHPDAISHMNPLWSPEVKIPIKTASNDKVVLTSGYTVRIPLKFGALEMEEWCFGLPSLRETPLLLGKTFTGRYQTHMDLAENTFHEHAIFQRIAQVNSVMTTPSATSAAALEGLPEEAFTHMQELTKIYVEAESAPEDFDVTELCPDDERRLLWTTCSSYRQALVNATQVKHSSAVNIEMLDLLGAPEMFDNAALPTAGPDESLDWSCWPKELPESLQTAFRPLPGLPPSRGEFDLRITLKPGAQPTAQRAYRMARHEEEEMIKQVNEGLRKGTMRRSRSPFAAPLVFVTKGQHGEELRMCFDYRRLNQITIRDAFPMPLIKALIDRLEGAQLFTALDLKSGYNQILIHPEDVHKAAFITPHGLFEPLVMPFGLCNAPALFQRMMMDYLAEEINEGLCVVYIDDILIYGGKSRREHAECVKRVIGKIIECRLTLKLSKSKFFQTEVEFLGHKISREGRQPVESKVDAILNWELPRSLKDLRGFLGLAVYYHDNIKGFSHIAAPLHELTTKEASKAFKWTAAAWDREPRAKAAFAALKEALTTAPVLRLMTQSGRLRLTVDASGYAVGAVLEQEQFKELGSQKSTDEKAFFPLGFYSLALLPSQLHWPTRTKELFALAAALIHWRHYLLARPFEVRTDHESLARILGQKAVKEKQAANDRILRMVEVVAAFHPHIRYIKGAENLVADALSRALQTKLIPLALEGDSVGINAVMVESVTWFLRQRLDSAWELHDKDTADYRIYDHLKNPPEEQDPLKDAAARRYKYADGLLWYMETDDDDDSWVLYAPMSMREGLVRERHEKGHFGVKSMMATMRQKWYWKGMSADLKDYADRCDSCRRNKSDTQKPQGLPQRIEIPKQPWTHLAMDFFTGLGSSHEDNGQVLLVVCMFSKMIKLIPLPTATSTDQLVEAVRTHLIDDLLRGQMPTVIVSDRDKIFRDKWKKEMQPTELRKASKKHPESDGLAERSIKSIKERLRTLIDARHADGRDPYNWQELLPYVELYYNSTVHSSMRMSPYQVVYGMTPEDDDELLTTDDTRFLTPEQQDRQRRLRYQLVEQRLYETQDLNMATLGKRRREPYPYKVGDHVFVATDVMRDLTQLRALQAKYVGPLKVLKVGTNYLEVEQAPYQRRKKREVNLEHVKPCFSDCSWPSTPPRNKAEAIERLKRGDAFSLVAQKNQRGKEMLYVDWKGCNPAMLSPFYEAEISKAEKEELARRSIAAHRTEPAEDPFEEVILPPLPWHI